MIDAAWLHDPTVLIALTALLGLLVGSFLNVVILRLPRRLEFEWQAQARELLANDVAMGERDYLDLKDTPQTVQDATDGLARTAAHLATLLKKTPYPEE